MNRIKKIFFPTMFAILYLSFVAQLVYVISLLFTKYVDLGSTAVGLGLLAGEWFVLIAARYLSKKSASSNREFGGERSGGYHSYRH